MKEIREFFKDAMTFKSDAELVEFRMDMLQLDIMDLVQTLMRKKKITKADLAKKMGTTPRHLTEMFTADVGIFKKNIVDVIVALTEGEVSP